VDVVAVDLVAEGLVEAILVEVGTVVEDTGEAAKAAVVETDSLAERKAEKKVVERLPRKPLSRLASLLCKEKRQVPRTLCRRQTIRVSLLRSE